MTRPPDARPPRPPNPSRIRSATARANQPPAVNSLGIPLARCEFCREPIIWAREMDNPNARTPEGRIGKLVPIDPEPSTEGRATLAMSPPSGRHPQYRVGEMRPSQAAAYREAGKPTYMRHVKTCTKADELRRGVVRRHGRR